MKHAGVSQLQVCLKQVYLKCSVCLKPVCLKVSKECKCVLSRCVSSRCVSTAACFYSMHVSLKQVYLNSQQQVCLKQVYLKSSVCLKHAGQCVSAAACVGIMQRALRTSSSSWLMRLSSCRLSASALSSRLCQASSRLTSY